jgi:glycosyltransferase involved in cell wall biosynthesis
MWRTYAQVVEHELSQLQPDATFTLPHAFPNVSSALDAADRGITVYAPLLHEEDPAWDVGRITGLVSRADIVVALTSWERERLTSDYGADPDATIVVPPSTNAPRLQDVESWRTSSPYVVSVGRRAASKHLPTVTHVVAEIREEGFDVRHVIVGPPGDPRVDHALATFGQAVEIVGEVNEQSKWSIIKGAIATVSMSDRESFGITTLESWRMGTPPVSKRIPATEELIKDGDTGILVDNENGLRLAIRTLISRPETAAAMGEAGLHYGERFSWRASAHALTSAI